MGRPTILTTKVKEALVDAILDGVSVKEFCRRPETPSERTIYKAFLRDEEFVQQYARAKEISAYRMDEELLEISDDGTNDWMMRRQASGGGRSDAAGEAEVAVPNHEHINRSKLRVDTRKWLMSKIAPKKYGDKVIHAGDAENPIALVPVLNVYTIAPEAHAIEHKPLNGTNGKAQH